MISSSKVQSFICKISTARNDTVLPFLLGYRVSCIMKVACLFNAWVKYNLPVPQESSCCRHFVVRKPLRSSIENIMQNVGERKQKRPRRSHPLIGNDKIHFTSFYRIFKGLTRGNVQRHSGGSSILYTLG